MKSGAALCGLFFSRLSLVRESGERVNTVVRSNPLAGLQRAELQELGRKFVVDKELGTKYEGLFQRAAMLAQDPLSFREPNSEFQTNRGLGAERDALERELTHKWDQPKRLYALVITCSLGAVVQGWDETAINGANTFYQDAFGITKNKWLYGLVNSAPYFCCALIGCWLTEPLNHYCGRRGAIFISCVISSVTCLGQAFTQTWQQMLVARFLLGLGIGPKSATIPVYASECTPPTIRGGLVMMWQMWTAFGIMLGLLFNVAFLHLGDGVDTNLCSDKLKNLLTYSCSVNWRFMVASPMFCPLIVCALVYFSPESPRWYIKKGNYKSAFESLIRLRHSNIQAARDLIYIHVLLEAERRISDRRNRIVEVFTIPRNRHALQASLIVMVLQQLCGVNVLAYYSSDVLVPGGPGRDSKSVTTALLGSMGFGIINFVFALPAVRTIDTFGRRNLLLFTFPLMALCMLLTFLLDRIPNSGGRAPLTLIGMYLFAAVYSPGEGPVPFVYSAECYPLYIRDIGMSIATAVTWFFNALLTITWPPIKDSIGSAAFTVYAALNLVGFVFILLLVPETRNRTLEELNSVFEVPSRDQAMYGMRQLSWFFGKSGEQSGVSRDEGELRCRLWESGPAGGDDRNFPADISPSPVSRMA
ncbi:and other transporter-domain-containing protein [Tuber borchii]|uniref:And other transporter-domain-containing protein n=1 Tax=Tuber borchii TaxID=42251 RepID=A0A2T6ZXP0_TUBBO|nr:and other transporter-domain-containing protein [Tuber borchii]